MELKCKFCDNQNDSTDNDIIINMFCVDNEIVFCCFDCVEEKIPLDTDGIHRLKPITMSDGWQVIDEITLKQYLEQKKALIAVSGEMEEAEHRPPSDTYYRYPAGRLKDIFKRLNETIQRDLEFKEKLGLDSAYPDQMLTGAYCPLCKSPLIKTNQQVASLAISDIVAGHAGKFNEIKGFGKRKQAFVCLGCLTTYIEDRDYE